MRREYIVTCTVASSRDSVEAPIDAGAIVKARDKVTYILKTVLGMSKE